MLGLLAVAFVAGSFVASPELRAQAAATIGSADIIDNSIQSVDIKDVEVKTADLAGNSVTAAKIKDGEVKAAEIATDAVGGAELSMVTKLIFGQCMLTNSEATTNIQPLEVSDINCSISGVDNDDSAVATLNNSNFCFHAAKAEPETNSVHVNITNECSTAQQVGSDSSIAVMVFDK